MIDRKQDMKFHKQSGLTLIGFIIVLSFTLFLAYIGMKIGPIYLEYYSVVTAMEGVAAEKGSARYSPYQRTDCHRAPRTERRRSIATHRCVEFSH